MALLALSSNIQFWRTTNYFAPDAEENPLLHTWSLSLEEQFYLIVPFMVLLVFRLHRERFIAAIFVICSLISFFISIFHLRYDQSGAFYLLPSRAWELGIGCILAMLPSIRVQILRSFLGYLGLGLIIVTYFFYDPRAPFPGIGALPPVLGAAFIILSGFKGPDSTHAPAVTCILGSKPLVFVGLCSYSYYLWHWPLFAFHRYLFSNPPAASTAILYVVVSFIIAVASLYLVERPFRGDRFNLSQPLVFIYGGVTVLLFFCLSISIYKTDGVPSRIPEKVIETISTNEQNQEPQEKLKWTQDGIKLRLIGQTDLDPSLLLWGDSHALASLPAIDEVSKNLGFCTAAAVLGGTAPVLDWARKKPEDIIRYNRSVFDFAIAEKEKNLTHVLLILHWSLYTQGQKIAHDGVHLHEGFPDALVETIIELDRSGLNVVLFKETPFFPVNVPRATAFHEWHGTPLPTLTYEENQKYRAAYDSIIKRIRTATPETIIFDPQPLFLGQDGKFVFLDTDGKLLFNDKHHLSRLGAMRMTPEIIKIFKNISSGR